MERFLVATIFILITALPLTTAYADGLSGKPKVLDARTLSISGQSIRLLGIAVPEESQRCLWGENEIPCGRMAKLALKDLLVGLEHVDCTIINKTDQSVLFGRCLADGYDLGSNMVHTGWALAFGEGSLPYVPIQAKAEKARRGLWKGKFDRPWEKAE